MGYISWFFGWSSFPGYLSVQDSVVPIYNKNFEMLRVRNEELCVKQRKWRWFPWLPFLHLNDQSNSSSHFFFLYLWQPICNHCFLLSWWVLFVYRSLYGHLTHVVQHFKRKESHLWCMTKFYKCNYPRCKPFHSLFKVICELFLCCWEFLCEYLFILASSWWNIRSSQLQDNVWDRI